MQIHIDRLIRSRRKTIALIVERDGSLTIRAPMRASTEAIESFAREKTGWIERARAKLKSMPEIRERRYEDGETFPYLGSSFELKLVETQQSELVFDGVFHMRARAQKRGAQVFARWYKERAFEIISERVAFFARQNNFSPKQVKISSARARWGSCSSSGNLNFSYRLVMAPLDAIDYVVVHELAHLRVKNHSAKFWKLVESILPEYNRQRKWLRAHGRELNL